jgi:lactoylglutathione lyase
MNETFTASTVSPSLTVNDLEQSRSWYCDMVGFTVARNYEREGKLMAVALKAGDVEMLLTQDDGAKGLDRAKGEGFSLMFTTSQNIDDLANGIKARGGTLTTEPVDAPWGARVFRLQDPNGFKLVISSPRTS